MGKKKLDDNSGGFPKKYAKHLDPGWMEDADTMDEEGLKKVIIDSENSIGEQEKLRDGDMKLKEAKEMVKDLGGGYSDAMNHQRAKIKYALYNLEKSGKL